MNKGFIAILVAVFLVFGGLITWSIANNQATDFASYDSARFIDADDGNGQIADHIRGNPNASVIIVEWGDFSCSHCASYAPMYSRVAADYGDKIGWIHRNFPLTGYPNSLSAATATEAAGLQGYYWEMSDAMFANQALWYSASETARTDLYVEIFQRAVPDGDADQLRADMANRNIAKKIDFDKNLGKLKDIQGTPAIFCDGEQLVNGEVGDETKLRQFINDKLIAAGQEPGPDAPNS